MLSPRAPLFSVSLAFAIGCVLGLDGWISLRAALVILVLAGAAWLVVRRYGAISLAMFYALVICAGLAHTLLAARTIAPDDARRLPDGKLLETTQWRGIIAEEPASQYTPHASRRALDRTSFVFRLEAWRATNGRLFGADIDTPWESAAGDVRCTLLGPAGELRCGDELEFAAALEPVAPSLVPGEFNSRDMDARQGIFYEATIVPQDWRRIATGGGDWLQRLSYAARDWAYARLQIGLEDDPRTADFLAGMLIGYRQQIPQDIEQNFRRTGTIHVFAVSGQNIAEMFVVALVLLQLFGLVRWRWAWIIAPIVLLYCLLTGSPASAVRATVMALAVLAAWRLGRPLNALGCWSLAFLAMMIWNPEVLLDPGAQLSFALVLSLILIAPPILRFCMVPFSPDPFLPRSLLTGWQRREWKFWQGAILLFSSGLAAVLVCEPITAVDFHQITPISIFANLVVVPMAGLITTVGTMSIAVSLVSTPITALLNNANWLLAKILIWFVALLAYQPGAMINVPDIAALQSPRPSLVVAPLRDSACLLIRTNDGAWLINSGRESASPSSVWHFLQFYGINRLDGLVLAQVSSPDNSGAEAIVRDFRPRELVIPVLRTRSPMEKELAEIVALSRDDPVAWREGQEIDLGAGLRAEILHPGADSPETHADDRGLVMLFRSGTQTLLWAGRIDAATQRALLAAHPGLRADVLVMGTESPPDDAWLASLQVRDWLQIPPRTPRLNLTDPPPVPEFCRIWPLSQTGAIDIHFAVDRIFLRPWVAGPDR
ncbi:MAG TPA: ComEC/Rec2 family competence protein [Candidatus Methylacidiphilales bacterium]|jgi:ComEC/Rec2-related protein|nr:ComEC/Rec2 family competence protein [Candidatus Methylacidiphilales bacterium]